MKTLPATRAELPQVFRSPRTRRVGVLLIMIFTMSYGFSMVSKGQAFGYFVALPCILFTITLFVNLLPGAAYLRLERDSFTFCSLYRCGTVRWQDCERFGLMQVRRTVFVGWKTVADFRGQTKLQAANGKLFGLNAALPDNYGFQPQALADAMQRLRDEAVATSATTPPPGLVQEQPLRS